jgi:hypothetical protein
MFRLKADTWIANVCFQTGDIAFSGILCEDQFLSTYKWSEVILPPRAAFHILLEFSIFLKIMTFSLPSLPEDSGIISHIVQQ